MIKTNGRLLVVDLNFLKKELVSFFTALKDGEGDPNKLMVDFLARVEKDLSLSSLEKKLDLLYNYEKNYLELVKEFKEEIKFASSIQEDIRKERSNFFAQTLKEVSATLKDSQVSDAVASRWIEELVSSYTKSLSLSGNLVDEHAIDTIGELRKGSKEEAKKLHMVENSNRQDAKKDE